MDVLIESTRRFENDLAKLSSEAKTITIEKINDCASLFPKQKLSVYRKLRRLPLSLTLNGYDSSLYILRVSQKLRVILSVDEDPIFGQVIFTLFRVVKGDEIEGAYRGIAESLYQELFDRERETAQVS